MFMLGLLYGRIALTNLARQIAVPKSEIDKRQAQSEKEKPRRNERRKARSQSFLRASRLLPFDFEQRHWLLSILDADRFAGRKSVSRTRGLGGCFAD